MPHLRNSSVCWVVGQWTIVNSICKQLSKNYVQLISSVVYYLLDTTASCIVSDRLLEQN